MSDRKGSNKIDLLDRALAAYGQVDPPPGLEARILGKLDERQRRRRFTFRLLLAVGTGAASLGLLLFLVTRAARVPEPGSTIATGREVPRHVVPNTPPTSPAVPKTEIARVRLVAADAAAPRQAAFPSPSEPSDQERAFVLLMRSRQEILVAMSQSRPPEIRGDIEIAPIKLDPLPGADLETSETEKH
jgi:hypothetical protein